MDYVRYLLCLCHFRLLTLLENVLGKRNVKVTIGRERGAHSSPVDSTHQYKTCGPSKSSLQTNFPPFLSPSPFCDTCNSTNMSSSYFGQLLNQILPHTLRIYFHHTSVWASFWQVRAQVQMNPGSGLQDLHLMMMVPHLACLVELQFVSGAILPAALESRGWWY